MVPREILGRREVFGTVMKQGQHSRNVEVDRGRAADTLALQARLGTLRLVVN
jgi:hypothetical protein